MRMRENDDILPEYFIIPFVWRQCRESCYSPDDCTVLFCWLNVQAHIELTNESSELDVNMSTFCKQQFTLLEIIQLMYTVQTCANIVFCGWHTVKSVHSEYQIATCCSINNSVSLQKCQSFRACWSIRELCVRASCQWTSLQGKLGFFSSLLLHRQDTKEIQCVLQITTEVNLNCNVTSGFYNFIVFLSICSEN